MTERPDDVSDEAVIAAIAKACEETLNEASDNRPLAFHLAAMVYGVGPAEPGCLADKERDALLVYAEKVRRFLDGEQTPCQIVSISRKGE